MAFKKKVDISNADGFKFEKIGQSLEGYYLGTHDIVIQGRDVKKHVFQTSKGLVSVLGQTHLTQLLEGINLGVLTRMTFVGTKKTKQVQPMKLFDVEYDETMTVEVGAIENSSAPEEPQYSEDAQYVEEGVQEEAQEEQAYEEPVQAAPPPRRPAPPAAKPAAPAPRAASTSTVTSAQSARAKQLLSGGAKPRA